MSRRALYITAEIGTPLLLIGAVWAFTARGGSYYYPPLGDILTAFRDNWFFANFETDFVPSLLRLLAGFLLAIVAGVGAGLVLGSSRLLRRQVNPIVEFLRAVPAPVLIPLAMLIFGIGNLEKVVLIAFVCVWPVLLNTIDGLASIDATILETGRSYRIRLWDLMVRVELPAASPQIFAGVRTSLPLALILMVISEMVASTDGVGYFILQAQKTFAITDMWSGILLLGILGYLLNLALTLVERRVLAWHHGSRSVGE